jgi:hypothetical protein
MQAPFFLLVDGLDFIGQGIEKLRSFIRKYRGFRMATTRWAGLVARKNPLFSQL